MGFRLSEVGSDPRWPPKHNAQPRAAWCVVCWAAHAIRAPWPSVTVRPKQVPLSAVVVQYLHFRAGISELRALPVCWHEAGWQWQPSLPTSWAHLEPSAWHKNQKKVGQCLPAGSGVVLAPGKVRWALLLVWDCQGQGKSSQAEPGQANPESSSQGTTTSQPPQMLNGFICLGKCWWSSADSCKDAWASWKSYSDCLLEVVVTLLHLAYTESSFWETKSGTKIGGFWAHWFSAPCSTLLRHLPEVLWLLLSFSIEQRQYMKAVSFRKRKYFQK